MRRARGSRLWLASVTALGIIGAAAACRQAAPTSQETQRAASPANAPRVLATLPEFVLENDRGESIGLSDLRRNVWVADFFTAALARAR